VVDQTWDASRAVADLRCKQGSDINGMKAGQWQNWDTRKAVRKMIKEKVGGRDEMSAGRWQT
jgi:hypothetical protein